MSTLNQLLITEASEYEFKSALRHGAPRFGSKQVRRNDV